MCVHDIKCERVASLDSSMERHDPVIKLAVLTQRCCARHGCWARVMDVTCDCETRPVGPGPL